MRVIVNGKDHAHEGQGDLTALLKEVGAEPAHVAVLLNDCVVMRAAVATTTLSEGDRVELVTLAAGG